MQALQYLVLHALAVFVQRITAAEAVSESCWAEWTALTCSIAFLCTLVAVQMSVRELCRRAWWLLDEHDIGLHVGDGVRVCVDELWFLQRVGGVGFGWFAFKSGHGAGRGVMAGSK